MVIVSGQQYRSVLCIDDLDGINRNGTPSSSALETVASETEESSSLCSFRPG